MVAPLGSLDVLRQPSSLIFDGQVSMCPVDCVVFGIFDHPSNYSVKNECNDDCNCIERYYFPTCVGIRDQITGEIKGKTYFSPCHAGCNESVAMPPDEDNPDGYDLVS